MNSEELEVSLRTEFENYLKNVFAEMRQDISQLQQRIEGELDTYRAQLDSVFKEAMERTEREQEFDAGFSEAVIEHLRLAKDEGARITATAIAEAEEMEKQSRAEAQANVVPTAGVKELYEAVSDISTKHSQAEILKTLVQHAGQFTPRGAFFIVKNEYFVGWRTFGNEKGENSDEAVREVYMSVTSDSMLSEAYRSLSAVESSAGTFADDEGILSKLGFEGSPEKMYAIPLVVRGRAVAVLYADYGTEGGEVNVEALETMVRVASLTVEVLASAKSSSRESKKKTAKAFAGEGFAPVAEQEPKESGQPEYAAVSNYSAPVSENSYQSSFENESYAQPSFREEPADEQQYSAFEDYKAEPAQEETPSYQEEAVEPQVEEQQYSAYEEQSWSEVPVEAVTEVNSENYSSEYNANQYAQDYSTDTQTTDSQDFSYQPSVEQESQAGSDFSAVPTGDYQFDYQAGSSQAFEEPKAESIESFSSQQAENFAPVVEESSSFQPEAPKAESSYTQPVEETVSQPVQQSPPVRSRFSERNVDLPIEVTEDERRLHNDARRFARLLVSEIKLYNEEKVREGRESSDLYDRLREAIDRSREMYDKRVQPPVAAKFDYFNYELVNSLAEGDASKLGENYPGAYI